MMIVSPSWLYHCWVAAQCIHVFTRMHLCLARCELHLLPLRRLECEMRTVNCTCCLHRWLLAAPAESKHPIKAPNQSIRVLTLTPVLSMHPTRAPSPFVPPSPALAPCFNFPPACAPARTLPLHPLCSVTWQLPLHDYDTPLTAYRSPVIQSLRVTGELQGFLPAIAAMEGAVVGQVKVSGLVRGTVGPTCLLFAVSVLGQQWWGGWRRGGW